jgi:hypothetical protein
MLKGTFKSSHILSDELWRVVGACEKTAKIERVN